MLSDVGGGGLASVMDVQSLFVLLKKFGFSPWPGMLSQTVKPSFDDTIALFVG